MRSRSCFDQVLAGSYGTAARRPRTGGGFVLVSWNIERGIRFPEILRALRGPLAADLLLLQEVDLNTRRTGYRNVAEDLARELGMNYVFGTEFEELAQGRSSQPTFHGQVVLGCFPMTRARVLRFRNQLHDWSHRWLPRWSWVQPRRGGRMALVVEIPWGGRTCVIYNAHLESKGNDAGRAQQMREILDDIQGHYPPDYPVIVAGDFNTGRTAPSPVLQELKAEGLQSVLQDLKGTQQATTRSNHAKDWIFLRHFQFRGAEIRRLDITDHYPLVVSIAVPQVVASRPTAPR